MITPDPVIMSIEQGREFEIEIGRIEDVKIETTTPSKSKTADISAAALEKDGGASKVSGEPNPDEVEA